MDSRSTLSYPAAGGCLSLYAGKSSCGVVPRFVVSLTMHVDRQVLEDAANEVISLFPHLRMRLVKDAGAYAFAPEESRIHVRDGLAGGDVLGSGPDPYLFRISCSFKTVCFDIHSSLLDERGMLAFVKSVIFRYIQLSGYEIDNDGSVRCLKGELPRESADDPFDAMEDIPASRPAWYMDAKAFNIPLPESDSAGCHVVQMQIPLSRLRSHAREYADVPETFISPIVSHALLQEYGAPMAAGEYVVAAVSVNLRRFFPTLSLKPFSINLSLAYNRKFGDYPFNTILMSQKKFIEAQLKPDALAYNALRTVADYEKISEGKSLDERMRFAADAAARQAKSSTYMLHNAGTVGMPSSMMRYVTEFYPIYVPSVHPFVLSSVIFGNVLVLTSAVKEGCRSAGLCRRIVSLMNENDICAFISDEFDFVPMKYKPL